MLLHELPGALKLEDEAEEATERLATP